MLIYTIHRKGLSEELLSKARLLRVCDMKKSNYDTKKILNEIFSFDFLGAHNATISTTNVDEASKENLKNLPLSDQGNSSPELTGRTSKNEIGLLAKTEHSINTTSIKEKDIDLTFPFEENSNNKATISTQIRNGRAYSSGDITANVFDNNFFYDKFSGIDQKQYDYELVDNILNVSPSIYSYSC